MGWAISMSVPFAVLRVEKVKSYAALAAMGNHWFRLNYTPNADSTRSHLNKTIIGDNNIVDNVKNKLKAKGISKLRKNGVLALELVLTFSPEFIYHNETKQYRKDANERLKHWVKRSIGWARTEFGDSLVSAIIHLDESTPHLHLCVLPLKAKKNGKYGLCARDITGGKAKLQAMQDSYHLSVKSLGLQRGLKRQRCKHQTIADYHTGVKRALKYIKEEGLSAPEKIGKVNPFMDSIKQLKSNYQNDVEISKQKSTSLIKQLLKIIQDLTLKLSQKKVTNAFNKR